MRVRRLAQEQPRAYIALTLGLALLGRAATLLLPFATLVGLISIPVLVLDPSLQAWDLLWIVSIGAGTVLAGWLTFRLLRIRLLGPEGWAVSAGSGLQGRVDEIASDFGVSSPPRAYITAGHELELIHTPDRAMPLRFSPSLRIGAQVLLTTSPEYLEVLIAGCMGQLRARLHRPGAWVGRQVQMWSSLRAVSAHARGCTGSRLHGLVAAYADLLERWTGPLIRREALFADQSALQLVNDELAKEAITQYALADHILQAEYWPHYWTLSKRHANPPYLPYSRMFRTVLEQSAPERASEHLERLMGQDPPGVRPSLRERLDIIGHRRADPPAPFSRAAARALLSAQELKRLLNALDDAWLKTNTSAWQERHKRGRKRVMDGLRLHNRASAGKLSDRESWDFTLLIQRKIRDKRKASKLYRRVLKSKPTSPLTWFFVGQRLLEYGDERGIAALKRAAEMDPGMADGISRLIAGHNARSARQATPNKWSAAPSVSG
jgi:tetratricopeptide (TPR) repeat protein